MPISMPSPICNFLLSLLFHGSIYLACTMYGSIYVQHGALCGMPRQWKQHYMYGYGIYSVIARQHAFLLHHGMYVTYVAAYRHCCYYSIHTYLQKKGKSLVVVGGGRRGGWRQERAPPAPGAPVPLLKSRRLKTSHGYFPHSPCATAPALNPSARTAAFYLLTLPPAALCTPKRRKEKAYVDIVSNSVCE